MPSLRLLACWPCNAQEQGLHTITQTKGMTMFNMFQKKTHLEKLKVLLSRKEGVTAAEIARMLPTTSPYSRMSRLQRKHLWTIYKKDNADGTKQYFGEPPKTVV
jgi:transcriptional regulator